MFTQIELIPDAPQFCDRKSNDEIAANTLKELSKLQQQIANNPSLLNSKQNIYSDNESTYSEDEEIELITNKKSKTKTISVDKVINDKLSETNRYLKLDLNNKDIKIEELTRQLKILQTNYDIDKIALNYVTKSIRFLTDTKLDLKESHSDIALKFAKINDNYNLIKKLEPSDNIKKYFDNLIDNKFLNIKLIFEKIYEKEQIKETKKNENNDGLVILFVFFIIYAIIKTFF